MAGDAVVVVVVVGTIVSLTAQVVAVVVAIHRQSTCNNIINKFNEMKENVDTRTRSHCASMCRVCVPPVRTEQK